MKTRSLNTLYRIAYGRIMDAVDDDYSGICHLVSTLVDDDLITINEWAKLKEHLYRNRPSEWKHIEFLDCIDYDDEGNFWWPKGKLEQRRLFLLKMIECTKPWYIRLAKLWKDLRSIERL